jgi:hypothetical protein
MNEGAAAYERAVRLVYMVRDAGPAVSGDFGNPEIYLERRGGEANR